LLVIDEASQCDIASALPLLFRAKRVVVIGDPMQLKHISKVPDKQDRALLAQHDLLPGGAGWSYSVTSLYDRAATLGRSEDIVGLRDHHRSHAAIVKFSNETSYEGRLRVATKYNVLRRPANRDPAVVWRNVAGSVQAPGGRGAVNPAEAEALVRELERLVLEQGYRGTVGAVTPFKSQALRIGELVKNHTDLDRRLQELHFLADTVHSFQGDERDVMLFSPVLSEGINRGAEYFLSRNPNLFNVAITRARASLIVVGNLEAVLRSKVDYLRRFAEYARSVRDQEDELARLRLRPTRGSMLGG
jgi:superfamily I DNA and/or RNA helicase